MIGAHGLESLMERHNWFLKQLIAIPRRFLLAASYLFWQQPVLSVHCLRSAVHDHRLVTVSPAAVKRVQYHENCEETDIQKRTGSFYFTFFLC
jgi:hypothetical protein